MVCAGGTPLLHWVQDDPDWVPWNAERSEAFRANPGVYASARSSLAEAEANHLVAKERTATNAAQARNCYAPTCSSLFRAAQLKWWDLRVSHLPQPSMHRKHR